MRFKCSSLLTILVFAGAGLCGAQPMGVAPDRTNGVYEVGDTVHWRVTWNAETSPPPAHYRFLRGEMADAGQGDLVFSNNLASLETRFDAPGTMWVELDSKGNGEEPHRALGRAVAAPDRIALSAPPPADFNDFWKAKLKELAKVPADPRLEKVDIGKTNLLYW